MRIAVVGIGSDILSDDSVGVRVVREMKKLHKRHRPSNREIRMFEGGIAPENITGAIRDFSPSYVFLVDAINDGQNADSMRIIPKKEVSGISFSTHTLPLYLLADYLDCTVRCKSVIIGVNPREPDISQLASKILHLCTNFDG